VWQGGKDTLSVTQNQCSESVKTAEYFANAGENLAKWQGSPSPMLPPCSKKACDISDEWAQWAGFEKRCKLPFAFASFAGPPHRPPREPAV
jgi:hypothetical protein